MVGQQRERLHLFEGWVGLGKHRFHIFKLVTRQFRWLGIAQPNDTHPLR